METDLVVYSFEVYNYAVVLPETYLLSDTANASTSNYFFRKFTFFESILQIECDLEIVVPKKNGVKHWSTTLRSQRVMCFQVAKRKPPPTLLREVS